MTGADPQREAMVRDREDAAAPSAAEGTPTDDVPAAESTLIRGKAAAGGTLAEGTRTEGAATDAATPGVRTPQPLSSLSSLVGDGFAGGSTCTADGICD